MVRTEVPALGKDNHGDLRNYFVADKAAAKENMNPYYKLCEKRNSVIKSLKGNSDFRSKVSTSSTAMSQLN